MKERITIYGKGGIGKSFIASNLSYIYAQKGLKVLHVGCDPKSDSTITLIDKPMANTVLDAVRKKGKENIIIDDIINKGILGIDCIEAGGPEPGVGCAGYGIIIMFDVLTELGILDNYDVVIYDVLGDVVCGGFATPLKLKFGKKVMIVTSEEVMAMYAANNICKAINNYDNGIFLAGMLLNSRGKVNNLEQIKNFPKKLSTDYLGIISRSDKVRISELKKKPFVSLFPEHTLAKRLRSISNILLKIDDSDIGGRLTPLTSEQFYEYFS